MPHCEETRVWCRSMSQLSHLAEEFVKDNGSSVTDMKLLLQQCVDTLSNYQDECKKIKSIPWNGPSRDMCDAFETAYVYFKIVSLIVLNKIPKLEEYSRAKTDSSNANGKALLEIYNMLVNRLIKDEKITEIKKFVRENSRRDNHIDHAPFTRDLRSGGSITAPVLYRLLTDPATSSSVLLIDVRPRVEFVKNHIKFRSLICIEPVSFKDSYSDLDIGRKAMVTSSDWEISLFQERDRFEHIVVYSQEGEQYHYYMKQQKALVNLLINRSFEKSLKNCTILSLRDGFFKWSSIYPNMCEESSQGENIYLDGSTSGSNQTHHQSTGNNHLNVFHKPLSEEPNYDKLMASPNHSRFHQQPRLRHMPTFKDYFKMSSSSSNTNGRPGSVPAQLPNGCTKYPAAPTLRNNNEHMNSLSQLTSRAITSPTRTLSTLDTPHISSTHSMSNLLVNNNSNTAIKQSIVPFSQNVKALAIPQLITKTTIPSFSVGLVNCGNSCYMSCILQCLLGTQELYSMFLNNSYQNHINMNSRLGSKGVLARYFAQLVHQMFQQGRDIRKKSGSEKTAVVPAQFKIACGSINPLFRDRSQQDCQEFCQFLLDGLHEDLNQCGNNPPLKELSEKAEIMREMMPMRIASAIEWERYLTTDFSVIVDLFQGQYASQLRCKVCARTSTTYQPFSVLSVPVPSSRSCTIIDCFTEFTKIETLEQDEQWSCPDCMKRQPSTKKITITRLPRNLIIHLKRFDNMLKKNNVFVSYPPVLDLTSFWANDYDKKTPRGNKEFLSAANELPSRGQIPPFNYQLYGIACHTGTLYGGHYTAYVNKGSDLGWCYYDDTNWRQVRSAKEHITQNAYVLFYHRIHGV
ncbi:HFR007Wp [Eremothecium sinecaudum]|uniref:Ubiquitin carboxyl-terminal hydrolase n=1 Tax=Eremothecium sinecaudum TaxID=45286 RepID=A0A0X8HUP8_9SACH|nr:HFR007Wp [Eremothecium sinecaudum]AMD21862.1 HFR007Wp [Eremothecium sinecaudum]